MEAVATSHIWLDDRGRAWIDDTNVKVIEVALDRIAYGWDAEEIHRQHPSLSLAQIHAALSHYYDHQQEFVDELAARVLAVYRAPDTITIEDLLATRGTAVRRLPDVPPFALRGRKR